MRSIRRSKCLKYQSLTPHTKI